MATEHLIVTLIDQIRKYKDDPGKLAVILNSHDWSAAFDKLDPTMVAVKCIKIGIKKQLGESAYRLHEWQENMSIPLSNHGSPTRKLDRTALLHNWK